jgi:flagellar biosynthesis/type III secretory pathway M-ring protein FliF/YscJ
VLAEIHPHLPTLVERGAAWIARRARPAVAIVGAAIGAAALAIASARMEADVPLFDSDLHPSQTSEVENALTLWGEQHRENAQGTQVWVAASRRRDLLLRLTLAGLPHRYVPTSTEVLDDRSDALTPQSVIDDRRRSGIEGDLVTGLRRISGVADATVVLPPAPADAFSDDATRSPPSAAVQLVMQPGEELSADAVTGIKRFVASAYPGLSPEHVTVVDGSGAAAGATAPPDPAAAKERRVQSAVQSALDAVLGAGAAVVRVSVRTTGFEQQVQNTRTVPHGVLSADVGRERGSESNKTFDKERSVRKFAYDTLWERRVTSPDAESRISVAVFLDARRVDAAASGSIAALVRAAAGADLRAGDDVVVQQLAFAPAPTPPAHVDRAAPQIDRAVVPAAVTCAILLFGLASFPRYRAKGVWFGSHTAPDPEARRTIDGATAAAIASLEGESPQAAAYVIRRLPDRQRRRILDAIEATRRDDIQRFLEPQSDERASI